MDWTLVLKFFRTLFLMTFKIHFKDLISCFVPINTWNYGFFMVCVNWLHGFHYTTISQKEDYFSIVSISKDHHLFLWDDQNHVVCVWQGGFGYGDEDYMKILVGTHWNAYFFEIVHFAKFGYGKVSIQKATILKACDPWFLISFRNHRSKGKLGFICTCLSKKNWDGSIRSHFELRSSILTNEMICVGLNFIINHFYHICKSFNI